MTAPPLTREQAQVLVNWFGVVSELHENLELIERFGEGATPEIVNTVDPMRALIAIAESEE